MASTARTASQRAQMGDTAITAIPLHLVFELPEAKPTAVSSVPLSGLPKNQTTRPAQHVNRQSIQ